MKPTIWIGKEAVTVMLMNQIKTQLKASQLVKVKVQKSVLSTESVKDIAETVAKATSSTLVDIRGRTFTLYKKASEA
jgi:RNA-binding protein